MTKSYYNSVTDVVKQSETAMAVLPMGAKSYTLNPAKIHTINQLSKSQEQEPRANQARVHHNATQAATV